MKTLKASIALLGLMAIAGTDVAVAAPKQTAYDQCFTDDGYGRRRPCSAGSVGFTRVAKSKSSKSTKRRPPQSSQAQPQKRAAKWGDPGFYEGWTAPPMRAGGVGYKRSRTKAKQ